MAQPAGPEQSPGDTSNLMYHPAGSGPERTRASPSGHERSRAVPSRPEPSLAVPSRPGRSPAGRSLALQRAFPAMTHLPGFASMPKCRDCAHSRGRATQSCTQYGL